MATNSSFICGYCQCLVPTRLGHDCCGDCKEQKYCSIGCMEAHSSEHIPKCKFHRLHDLLGQINTIELASNWRKVLPLQSTMEMLMLEGPIDISNRQKQVVLVLFIDSNHKAYTETGHEVYRVSLIRLKENLVKLLGSMELFHEQGLYMTSLGGMFMAMKHYIVAQIYFQEVRDIGVAHGFFTMECKACLGLGRIAMKEGRSQEGLELLQNAVCASSLLLPTDNPREYEINAFYWLIDALFDSEDIDEAEKLMVRMAATVKQEEKDYIQINDMRVMIDKTRLYQIRGQHQAAVGQIQTLLAKVRKDVVYVCKWRAEFLRGIYGAKAILSDMWNKNLDKSLADVIRML